MASLIQRVLYRRRHNFTAQDAAKIARPATSFPSPNFKDNVKYLAYGSNLSAETFLGKRGIKPLSQVNVRVPSLALTFDLAGVPYKEPRFANVRARETGDQELIGVVYEVTPNDYRTILLTEGGYSVIKVPCIPLTPVEGIETFEANTLIIPPKLTRQYHDGVPSLRYLNLLLHGANEHGLPEEYQDYLAKTGYYDASTKRQKSGAVAVLVTALPVILFLFAFRAILSDKEGKAPEWFNTLQRYCFARIWALYDHLWKPLFGDGENDKHNVKQKEEILKIARGTSVTDELLGEIEEVTAVNVPDGPSRY
ncbi:hypothetical protein TWF694_011003 [Orbilia ellipsospora]|uniref:gamma-glutamylcyclotransferase n=1 Tax=Orbilia ellipsospora TaxID=2528407 RepID=A0AAV9X8Y9_9PEZI